MRATLRTVSPGSREGYAAGTKRFSEVGEIRMAKDVSDTVRDALGSVVREAVKNVGDASPAKRSKGSPLSGAKGIAAGAGLAAAAPLAKKGVDKIRMGGLS